MLAPFYRETLERFYVRVYAAPRPVRVASMAAVAGLTVLMSVWPAALAAIWLVAYLASEAWLIIWWRRVQPRLRIAGDRDIRRLESELIVICAVSCAVCAAPS